MHMTAVYLLTGREAPVGAYKTARFPFEKRAEFPQTGQNDTRPDETCFILTPIITH